MSEAAETETVKVDAVQKPEEPLPLLAVKAEPSEDSQPVDDVKELTADVEASTEQPLNPDKIAEAGPTSESAEVAQEVTDAQEVTKSEKKTEGGGKEKEKTEAPKKPQTQFVRCRGLPIGTTEAEMRNFFKGIAIESIIMPMSPPGVKSPAQCYVELVSKEDVQEALACHKKILEGSTRYIEVFSVNREELISLKKKGIIRDEHKVLRLRGIPFKCTQEEVKKFFGEDCDVEEVILEKQGDRLTGDAYIRVLSRADYTKALAKNKEYMGKRCCTAINWLVNVPRETAVHRYVEVVRCKFDDFMRVKMEAGGARMGMPGMGPPMPLMAVRGGARGHPMMYRGGPGREAPFMPGRGMPMGRRPAPYDIPGRFDEKYELRSRSKLYMRGIPFQCYPENIEDFFQGLQIVEIKMGYADDGRPSGDAAVEFATISEAEEALKFNKKEMGKRYVELFRGTDVPLPMRRIQFRTVKGGAPPLAPLAPHYGHGGPSPFGRGNAPMARVRGGVPPLLRRGGPPPPLQDPWARHAQPPAVPSPWEKGGYPPGAQRGRQSGYAETTPNPYPGYPPLKTAGGPKGRTGGGQIDPWGGASDIGPSAAAPTQRSWYY